MLKTIVTDILIALYQHFVPAVVTTALCMVARMYIKEHGWKIAIRNVFEMLRKDKKNRIFVCFVLYATMLVYRTSINRNLWMNPLSDVAGVWGLYNSKGEFTTEVIENLILFVPFSCLLLMVYSRQILGGRSGLLYILWKSMAVSFFISITIELLQLFFRLGTFQLSDLFYNTVGGLIGGFIFGIINKIRGGRLL